MQAFTKHTGSVALMDRANVDTDQIIPKQFLKRIERTGFGEFLFYDWRFLDDGSDDPQFELNRPEYRDATILLARRNFGCGSSREHAPWALLDYGFRVLIAPSFADIFYNNCFKNGILPLTFNVAVIVDLFALSEGGQCELTVDLTDSTLRDGDGLRLDFEIDPFRRECLLSGADEIALTLAQQDKITAYEAARGMKPVGSST